MIANKGKKDALTELETIIKDRNKILEIEETKQITENVLKGFKENKLENNLKILAAKNLF